MKRAILFFITCSVVLLLAAGCCPCRKQSKFVKPLVGTKWQLVQLMAKDVQPEGNQYTLYLRESGTFSARGCCNNTSGTYRMTTSRELDFTHGSMTLVACDELMELEYFGMLSGVTHYEMDGSMMLLFKNGELVAIMQAVE